MRTCFSASRCLAIISLCCLATDFASGQNSEAVPLDLGWEFHQGGLGSVWEIWRGDKASDNVTWLLVTLPHCFNARDAVDPDEHYYQGPGWYRTRIQPRNLFEDGRILLHFNGAGQKSQVFVGLEKVGEHSGGYDEWDVDITEAASRCRTNQTGRGSVPLAVLCDNSRDAESIPSDLSDFTRYGGIYRHVTLKYLPAISLENVHIAPALLSNGHASVNVQCRLYNPNDIREAIGLEVQVNDPQGKEIFHRTNSFQSWKEFQEIAAFTISMPELWSPKNPACYICRGHIEIAARRPTCHQAFWCAFRGMDRARPVQIERRAVIVAWHTISRRFCGRGRGGAGRRGASDVSTDQGDGRKFCASWVITSSRRRCWICATSSGFWFGKKSHGVAAGWVASVTKKKAATCYAL